MKDNFETSIQEIMNLSKEEFPRYICDQDILSESTKRKLIDLYALHKL